MFKNWTGKNATKRDMETAPCDGAVKERRRVIENLFREHNRTLVGFLRTRLSSDQEALDVAQEAYVKLLQLDKPQELSFLRSYLYKTAANLAVDYKRRQWTREKGAAEINLLGHKPEPNQEDILVSRQDMGIIREAISELSPKYRQAFLLGREGWSPERIAEHMDVSERSVRNYLHHTINHIADKLKTSAKRTDVK